MCSSKNFLLRQFFTVLTANAPDVFHTGIGEQLIYLLLCFCEVDAIGLSFFLGKTIGHFSKGFGWCYADGNGNAYMQYDGIPDFFCKIYYVVMF